MKLPTNKELFDFFYGFTRIPEECDKDADLYRFNGDPNCDVVIFDDGDERDFSIYINKEHVTTLKEYGLFMIQVRVGLSHRMRQIASTN